MDDLKLRLKKKKKMTRNELISNNNLNFNNYKNNIRFSQGHKKPIIKNLNDKNLRVSANDSKNINYHYQIQKEKEQNRINLLKKNLEGKPNNSNTKQIRQVLGKYNGNNLHSYNNYGINNKNNNAQGFYEGKDFKRNDTGRNRKNK